MRDFASAASAVKQRPMRVKRGTVLYYICPVCGTRVSLTNCACGRGAWQLDEAGPFRQRQLLELNRSLFTTTLPEITPKKVILDYSDDETAKIEILKSIEALKQPETILRLTARYEARKHPMKARIVDTVARLRAMAGIILQFIGDVLRVSMYDGPQHD